MTQPLLLPARSRFSRAAMSANVARRRSRVISNRELQRSAASPAIGRSRRDIREMANQASSSESAHSDRSGHRKLRINAFRRTSTGCQRVPLATGMTARDRTIRNQRRLKRGEKHEMSPPSCRLQQKQPDGQNQQQKHTRQSERRGLKGNQHRKDTIGISHARRKGPPSKLTQVPPSRNLKFSDHERLRLILSLRSEHSAKHKNTWQTDR